MAQYGNMSEEILSDQYNRNIDLNNFLVDDHRELLFCVIPKAACTNVIKTMAVSQDMRFIDDSYKKSDSKRNLTEREAMIENIAKRPTMKSHNRKFYQSVGMDYLTYTPRQELFHKFSTYKKFMVVRNPYTRILSAFRDKFEKGYDRVYRRNYGIKIGKTYRMFYYGKGDDITFNEFVKYIIDTWKKNSGDLERHWRPYFDLCHPCIIHYDLIAKKENLTEEFKPFFLWFENNSFDSVLAAKHGPKTDSSSILTVQKYYDSVDKNLIPLLAKVYDIDFKLFGYDNDRISFKS